MGKYAILGFDMETDIGSYLKTYNGVTDGTPEMLRVLKKNNIKGTFLFTGDAAQKNPGVVKTVFREGHEVGCHSLMHETVGDAHFNMPNDGPILEEEAEHRLALNTKIIKELIGKMPESFRAPRLWQGHGQVSALNRLGYRVDLSYSVAAHKDKILPYHPSKTDWTADGDLDILEIPNFAFLDEKHDYSKYFGGNDQWPLLRLLGADFVFENSKSFTDKQMKEADIAVLLFYLHPWEFIPMPEKFEYDEGTFYFKEELYKNCGDTMVREFGKLAELLIDDGFIFMTALEFAKVWDKNC